MSVCILCMCVCVCVCVCVCTCVCTCVFVKVMQDTVLLHKSGGELHPLSKPLEALIEGEELYTPVFLGDAALFKSMNSMQRHHFLESLSLPFPVDVLKYSPGGNLGNTIIVWRVPSSQTESEMITDAVQMTMQLKPRLPEYKTRQQPLDFNKSYGNIVKLTPAIRRSLYSCLTGDSCASSNPDMDARLHLALFGESPDMIYDLRRLNTGRIPSFEAFLEMLGKVIEEWVAADERRHGVAHLSQYLSLRVLAHDNTFTMQECKVLHTLHYTQTTTDIHTRQ